MANVMRNGGEALSSIIFAGRTLLVEMLITLEPLGIFRSNCVYLCILNCMATGMQNDGEALPSIILPGRALLVKMLITFEPHCIF